MNPWLIFGLFLIQAATHLAILDAVKPAAPEPPAVISEAKPMPEPPTAAEIIEAVELFANTAISPGKMRKMPCVNCEQMRQIMQKQIEPQAELEPTPVAQ